MRRTLETYLFVGGPLDGQRKVVPLDQQQVVFQEITKELIKWDDLPTDSNHMGKEEGVWK